MLSREQQKGHSEEDEDEKRKEKRAGKEGDSDLSARRAHGEVNVDLQPIVL